jgi:crossover junction endodeoxyribonuclease RuvC
MTIVCGIDPGLNGAIAILDAERNLILGLGDLPVHKVARATGRLKLEFNPHGLALILRKHRPDRVVIEQVGPMPKQGLSSTARFMYAAGAIYGIAAGLELPVIFVTPQRWQQHHRVGRGPDDAVRKVLQLYPVLAEQLSRKKDAHKADAMLIALFGAAIMKGKIENVEHNRTDDHATQPVA